MRRAADGFVDFAHFRRQLHAAAGAVVKPFLDFVETGIVEDFAPDDIELHGGAALLGIHVIAFAGARQDAAAMEDAVFQPEFGRDRIVPIALAQQHARFGVLRIRIAALNHKVLNHTMEQERIKRPFRHQRPEIVAMQRRLVIEFQNDGPFRRLHHDDLFLFLAGHGRQHHYGDQQGKARKAIGFHSQF